MITRKKAEKLGLKARERLGRNDLAEQAKRRFDPMDVLRSACRDHLPELIPEKFRRMKANAFAFLRGAVEIMAADLGAGPNTGIEVQLCGDAHLKNFGYFATPGSDIVLDVNDFDQTQRGPWEWDVKRMATSIMVAGRLGRNSEPQCRAATLGFLTRYCRAIHEFAEMPSIEVARYRVRRDKSDAAMRTALEKAQRASPLGSLEKLTRPVKSGRMLVEIPEEMWHVPRPGKARVLAALEEYRETLAPDKQIIFDRYTAVDVAFKIVGTGSVGTRDYVVLLFGRDKRDPLFLQVKQELPTPYRKFYPDASAPKHQGERVVRGQRAIQSQPDMLLGWCSIASQQYLVRQVADHKAGLDPEQLSPNTLTTYADICAELLAKAHARTSEPAMLAAYIGETEKAATALLKFAEKYADQTEADYEKFRKALKSGLEKKAVQSAGG